MQYGITYIVRPRIAPSNSASILRCASLGIHPVIVRAGVLARARADEGEMLDARDVGGVRAMQITIRVGGRVELDKIAAREASLRSGLSFRRPTRCTSESNQAWSVARLPQPSSSSDAFDVLISTASSTNERGSPLLQAAGEKQARDYTGQPASVIAMQGAIAMHSDYADSLRLRTVAMTRSTYASTCAVLRCGMRSRNR